MQAAVPEDLMPFDLQGRTQYLSLALFTRGVVAALLDFIETGEFAGVEGVLGDALSSLDGVNNRDLRQFAERKAAAFGSYQHLRTLEEAWPTDDKGQDAVRLIHNLLEQSSDQATRKADARKLVDLFLRLERQALWNFEQPRATSPRAIRELCRMA
jgi:hypothetical protein